MFGRDVEPADGREVTELTLKQRPEVAQDESLTFYPVPYGPQKLGADRIAASADNIVG